ncbi:MAG: AMP-binding protein [Actinobacteria bacterium]|nr:AMP-binding protein [Actinomycetota bacterium]
MSSREGHSMTDFRHFYDDILASFARYPAIIHGDEVITYRELDERTNRLAHAMLELGIKRDHNVGIAEYNTPAFLEVVAAAFKVTARAVTLNFKFKEWELKHVIEDAGMETVFFNEDIADRMVNLRPELPGVKNYVIIGERRVEGMLNYSEIVRGRPSTAPTPPWPEFSGDDVVVLMYTGGTTGYPKGVIYTHDQVLSAPLEAMIRNFAGGLRDLSKAPPQVFKGIEKTLRIPGAARTLPWLLSREATRRALIVVGKKAGPFIIKAPDPLIRAILFLNARLTGGKVRMLLASPMMHAWAYNHALIGMIGGFTSILLPSKSFEVSEMISAIEKHRANVLVAVGDGQCRPFADELDRAAAEGKRYDLGSLLVVLSSGMALSVDVKRRLLEHLPQLIILDVLASTEGHYISVTPYTAADRELEKTVFRVSDMVKVITEDGREARPGEIGEVAVAREHQGSSGYYGDAEKTARTYRKVGGKTYIFTGDMASVDEKGHIHLIGRGSGCINTGGEKVFPEEVEEVLNRHPAVELSGVTSVPHPRWGEAVTAVIQLKPGEQADEEEIKAWCKEYLADYKAPKYVLFVDELPRLITGKVHYREIKQLVQEKF